jgi:hypothetical protein
MADEPTGQELRRFFVELLADDNFKAYHAGRGGYIEDRVKLPDQEDDPRRYLGTEARRVLEEGTLAEIEDNIKLVTGSTNAVPVLVVAPPFF